MAVIGIERIVYCVDDLELSIKYFDDYGLALYERSDTTARFELPDNSRVYLRLLDKGAVRGSMVLGKGVHEVVWGVDTAENCERLIARIGVDREVWRDEAGIAHFVADGGIAMGLRFWHEKRAVSAPTDPINSPGHINRMNVHRRWIARARPKSISHVVFLIPEYEACFKFLSERLDFRLTDRQRGLGIYARCDGTTDHHNFFMLNANSGFPGTDGTLSFHHVNFTVTDLDEVMAGKNYMERRGWAKSVWGLGRHRIASALFCYLPCPAGGDAEYGADSDALDDGWVPRDFDPMFGFAHWVHDIPEFWLAGADWDVAFAQDTVPRKVLKHSAATPKQIGRDDLQDTRDPQAHSIELIE